MKEDAGAIVAQLETVAKNVVEAGSKTFIQVLVGPEKAPNFAMRCFTIEPGGGMPNHTNAVEHEQYVLSGHAEVGIKDTVYKVKEGDFLYIPAGVPHWYKNNGHVAFRFLCFVPNKPDTIEMVKGG